MLKAKSTPTLYTFFLGKKKSPNQKQHSPRKGWQMFKLSFRIYWSIFISVKQICWLSPAWKTVCNAFCLRRVWWLHLINVAGKAVIPVSQTSERKSGDWCKYALLTWAAAWTSGMELAQQPQRWVNGAPEAEAAASMRWQADDRAIAPANHPPGPHCVYESFQLF